MYYDFDRSCLVPARLSLVYNERFGLGSGGVGFVFLKALTIFKNNLWYAVLLSMMD